MLYGLKVIQNHLNRRETSDARVRVLSLGIGVGILERIFIKKFGAEIVGVDKDPDVMSFAYTYFRSSLVDDEWKGLTLISGYCALSVLSELSNGISKSNLKLVEACRVYKGLRYNVVLLNIIDHDDLSGWGACVPPRHFVEKSIFDKIKGLLDPEGAFVMQVIVPDICYEEKFILLGGCFRIVFKIALNHKSKYVLVATDSAVFASGENKPGRTSDVITSLVTCSFNIDETFY
ncbi:putative S-adenosyl-L-methionine-dependent methyltransferase [Helianthus annuus]|uniref:S-adenosyl-L-methionine-dependent methyltransferase n=1 Tax=Helianthus annuus TaxID=4232 RepID=A0A9K3EAE5_HELAN|nr:putative S-adenosyl-L-methionine-dependent methyltransferase [Helianthus annuus]KAJ0465145.1 putative S-adenosyl-L-methionine-dependent methyltransferase [Helianthus annuus]KAJ0469878.1 putative S-adenosyl-L-methionine-dependent methyltransferase [Helianthus annuus]KAJ0486737.1 putative S-adenosyl-L-methionine-dependent methyltransferase [Helianthus annuus]KAJ0660870.1 putative S-adenosyl-L-methionine-dependent methyltransferase [Helianthus annuus]